MTPQPKTPQDRREFLAQLGIAAALLTGGAEAVAAQPQIAECEIPATTDKWDTSWLDQLAKAQYRVVFDATNISDGYALDTAGVFLNHYHEVHDTRDEQLRAVIVMRQLGTPLALGDAIWDKFALGEELKINDRLTQQPARRNPFLRASGSGDNSLETLRSRGTILLLCNIAMNNWSSRHAEMTKRSVDDVREEVRANLVPGAIVVPSGIFALIRAQNAGCAYMRGA